ncbi:MAG: hypothetical protein HC837_10895 [Chloroflexaceae bacterium]|nr:hypothetical protein [Chloroflexaceae bacterium]
MPDWLRANVPDESGANDETAPKWMAQSESESEPEPEPERDTKDDTTPDWLRDLDMDQYKAQANALDEMADASSETEPAQPTDPEPARQPMPSNIRTPSPSGATDWLRSLGVVEQEKQPPDVLSDRPVEHEGYLAQPDDPTDELDMNWLPTISQDELERELRELGQLDSESAAPSDPSRPSATADSDLPDWLALESPPKPAQDESTFFPDWLKTPSPDADLETAAELPFTPTPAPSPTAPNEPPATPDVSPSLDLPGWLKGDDQDRETSDVELDADMPSWLKAPDVTEPAPSADVSSLVDDMPSWLQPAQPLDADDAIEKPPSDADMPTWLRSDKPTGPPAGSPPATEPPPAADADMPSWLQAAAPASPPAADTPSTDDDMPPWLQSGEPTDVRPAAPDSEADDIPPWLRSVTAETSADMGVADQMPAWLSEPEPATAPPAPAPSMDAEMPPWLAEPTTEEPSAAIDAADDLPPWMTAASDALTEVAAPTPLSSPDTDADLPPWLAGGDLADDADQAVGRADAALPSWLRGAETDVTTPQAETDAPDHAGLAAGAAAAGMAGAAAGAAGSAGAAATSDSFLGSMDLPSWLGPSETKEEKKSEEKGEKSDWLERLSRHVEEPDGMPAAQAAPKMALPRPSFSLSPAQLQAATLLKGLVNEPFPETPATTTTPRPSVLQQIGLERVLSVLLAIVLLVGAFIPSLISGLQSVPPASANVTALAEQINTLSEDDIVLLAYEWDAQRRAELSPLEQAVTSHLMEQQVDLVLISTDPQGTLLSFDLRDPLREAGYEGEGRDYLLMGFRPGGELALRSMAQNFRATLERGDFQGQDATLGALATDVATGEPRLSSIDDFAMIVVLADQRQDVQGWMEQVHRSAPDIPFVLVMPAEIAPIAQPYTRLPNVFALVGKNDALAYSANRGGNVDTIAIMDSGGQLAFSIVAFVAVLIIGTLIGILVKRK